MFGLSKAELLPVVEAISGAPIVSFNIDNAAPLSTGQGMCGDKLLVDLSFTTCEGVVGNAALFVKKFSWKGKSEAAHYRFLAVNRVPTPRLYGALIHSDGEEILFLERLNVIGYDRQSEAEWRQMLTLLAHFNAQRVTPDSFSSSFFHPYEQGGRIDGWWITGFNPFPPAPEEIEANLNACGVEERELSALCVAALRLCATVAAQPLGLLHQDFLPDNLGWRGEREEMVVFDIHKNCLGPRFGDVGPYLGLPDWSRAATFLNTISDRDAIPDRHEGLTRHYLDEYARFGGEQVSLETFREEAAALFWAHKVAILGWMAEQNDTVRIGEVLNYLRTLI